MMLSEAIAVGGVVSLTLVPDVLWVGLLIRVLLDCPVGVPCKEETIEGTGLAFSLVRVSHILRIHH